MMRNGNTYALYPSDANMIQVAYEWATNSYNKNMVIIASKSPLPVYTTLEQSRQAIEEGAVSLYESASGAGPLVVFAVTGDMVLLPVFQAKDQLEDRGMRVRIVAVANPRRLYRPTDVAWDSVAQPDGKFMDDAAFNALFEADALLGVSGGTSASLEPVLLRSRTVRDAMCWKRGETTASPAEIMEFNGLTPDEIAARVKSMLD
jgi:phosphoketolase